MPFAILQKTQRIQESKERKKYRNILKWYAKTASCKKSILCYNEFA